MNMNIDISKKITSKLEKNVNKKIDEERDRSIFKDEINGKVNIKKQLVGLFIFIIIFVIAIPYYLFANKYFGILEGYIPNVDMIATVLGFQREPLLAYKSYFEYLYNPDSKTVYGYLSQTFINYLALIGLTFFVAYYTFINKSISKGWARAFIMLPMTYLLPGNFIAYYMEKVSHYLDNESRLENGYVKDIIVYGVGVLTVLFFIFAEKFLIRTFGDYFAVFLSKYLD